MSKSIDTQVQAALDADPDIAAARAVSPGIVKGAPNGRRATAPVGGSGRGGVGKQTPVAVSATDQEIEAERHAAADRFTDHARKALEREEAEGVKDDQLKSPKTPKRGALLGDDDDPDEQGEEQIRDSDGKFTGKRRTKVEDEGDEGGEEGAPAEDDGMTHDKALAILRLEKFTSKALAKLSPEDAIQLARERAPVRAGVEAMAAENARLKKGGSPAVTEGDKGTPAQQQPATGTGTTFDFKKVTTRLRELYDEDVVSGLEEPISALAKWTEEFVASKEKQLEPLLATVGRMEIELARLRLGRVYPQLVEDDSFFNEVIEQAKKSNGAAYENNLHGLLEDAHNVVLAAKSKGKATPAARAARGRAQPTTSTRRSVSDTPISRHDAFGQIAALLEDGHRAEAQELAEMAQ